MNLFNFFFDLFKFIFHNGNIAFLAIVSFFMLIILPIIFIIRYKRFFKGIKTFQIKEYTLYNFIFLILISILTISLICSIFKLITPQNKIVLIIAAVIVFNYFVHTEYNIYSSKYNKPDYYELVKSIYSSKEMQEKLKNNTSRNAKIGINLYSYSILMDDHEYIESHTDMLDISTCRYIYLLSLLFKEDFAGFDKIAAEMNLAESSEESDKNALKLRESIVNQDYDSIIKIFSPDLSKKSVGLKTRYFLSLAYIRSGKYEKARDQLEKLYDLAFNTIYEKKAIELVKEYEAATGNKIEKNNYSFFAQLPPKQKTGLLLILSGIIVLTVFAFWPQYGATADEIYCKTFKISSNNCIIAEKNESEHYAEGIYLDYTHREIDYIAFKKSDKGYRITGIKRIGFDKISTEMELTQSPMFSEDDQATFLKLHLEDMEEKMLFYRKNPAFDELDKYILCYGALDEETSEKWKDTYTRNFEYIKNCGYKEEYSLYKVSY